MERGAQLEPIRALLLAGSYAEAESLARGTLAGTEESSVADPREISRTLDLLVEALWRGGKGGSSEAVALAQRALSLCTESEACDRLGLSRATRNLGRIALARGDYVEAASSLRRAAEISVGEGGLQGRGSAEIEVDLAEALVRAGQASAALEAIERTLPILEQAASEDPGALARGLRVRGDVRFEIRDFGAALSDLQRARDVAVASLGGDHPETAGILTSIGRCLRRSGDLGGALEVLERAAASQERRLGPWHPDLASTFAEQSKVLAEKGDLGPAREKAERSLAIREEVFGASHPAMPESLTALGTALRTLRDYPGARAAFERALRISETVFGPEDARVGQCLNNLALVCHYMSDPGCTATYARRSVDVRERALGAQHLDVAISLNTLAMGLKASGDLAGARSAYERSLRIREHALGRSHPQTAMAVHNLANLLRDTHAYSEAAALYEEILPYYESSLGPDNPRFAALLVDLGVLRGWMGDPNNLSLHRRALRIREEVLGLDHPDVAASRLFCAGSLWLTGGYAEAFEESLAASRIVREHLSRIAGGAAEREALLYRRNWTSSMDIALTAISSPDEAGIGAEATRRVWDEVVRSRALVLDAMALRHRASAGDAESHLTRLAADLESARSELAALLLEGAGDENPRGRAERIEHARLRKEALERDLARASRARHTDLERDLAGYSEVTGALGEGRGLIAYVRHERIALRPSRVPVEGGSGPRLEAASEPAYLAFVTRAGRPPIAIALPDTAHEIDSRVRAWRESVSSRPSGAEDLRRFMASAKELRRRIWDPVALHLEGLKTLFVVPDGTLQLVNLATLPLEGRHYLIESGPTLHMLSTERDLAAMSDEARPASDGSSILLVGGVDFEGPELQIRSTGAGSRRIADDRAPPPSMPQNDAAARGRRAGAGAIDAEIPLGECEGLASIRFDPLPGSLAEVEEVERLWRGHARPDGSPAPAIVKLTGAGATEASFRRAAPEHRILHLSTHAFSAEEACSRLDAQEPRSSATSEAAHGLAAEQPLLLTGLVFAGANRRAPTGTVEGLDDGLLSAEEIASLDLHDVEWVLLSACATGLGAIEDGEGVQGLRRAFQVAGARTLITTLWTLEDHDARDWMRHLYENRIAGRSTAESMREAGLRILRDRRRAGVSDHPYFWGTFVATGDPR